MVEPSADQIARAEASLRLLFSGKSGEFTDALARALDAMRADLADSARMRTLSTEVRPGDSADALNALAQLCGQTPFHRQFDLALFEALGRLCPEFRLRECSGLSPDSEFFHEHALRLAEILRTAVPGFLALLAVPPGTLTRFRPSVAHLHTAQSIFPRMKTSALAMEIRRRCFAGGLFDKGRVFRHKNGNFQPMELPYIRKVEDFYGYQAARTTFLDHYRAFSEGKSNLPLLISSLPGLGKTQMSIAHSLHFSNITLIIADPEDLSTGLEDLISALSAWPEKKFMLFFDDIDAVNIDWYRFRANIGGTFSLPANIQITIASNQKFPANISSRGRGFIFPMFDEIRCQEMIADFLVSFGIREPTSELISSIAADYVEEFGQKMFEELSPRTLVRYLEIYRVDARKRKTMLECSKGELIMRPDSQVFYDENIKLIRSIYGEEAIEEMKKDII